MHEKQDPLALSHGAADQFSGNDRFAAASRRYKKDTTLGVLDGSPNPRNDADLVGTKLGARSSALSRKEVAVLDVERIHRAPNALDPLP